MNNRTMKYQIRKTFEDHTYYSTEDISEQDRAELHDWLDEVDDDPDRYICQECGGDVRAGNHGIALPFSGYGYYGGPQEYYCEPEPYYGDDD